MPTAYSRPDFSLLEKQSPKKQREYFKSVRDQFRFEPVSAEEKNVERIDGLIFPRKRYDHHGICIGHEGDRLVDVVESTGPSSTITGSSRVSSCSDSGAVAIIKRKTYTYEELEKQKVIKVTWPQFLVRYSDDDIVSRAKGCVGEKMYGVLENNCEHFVSWCICGLSVSLQVKERYFWAKETFFSVCVTGKHLGEMLPDIIIFLKSFASKGPNIIKPIANISDEVAAAAGKNVTKMTKIGFCIGAALEVAIAIYEIVKVVWKWKKGRCTKEELKAKVVEVLAKGSFRLAGGIVGSILGGLASPAASLVCGAIGAAVGHFVGFSISWCYKNRDWLAEQIISKLSGKISGGSDPVAITSGSTSE